ncbi:MAG: ftnA [Bacillales bacterium]|jgi:ferritin|nr:ftnA [Bacillales bacterium]
MKEKLFNDINDQVNFELFSAHTYLSMAAYCSAEGLDGFANFFIVQAEEERFHGMKLYGFLNDNGFTVRIKGFEDPEFEFESLLDVFEKALEHEKVVTSRIYALQDTAYECREWKTINMLNWFVEEQVEEEASFDSLITKLKLIQNDSSAIYAMDNELAARTFTPPAK